MLFFLSLKLVSANTIAELDQFVRKEEFNKEELRKALEKEQNQYKETENYIYLLRANYIQAFIDGLQGDENSRIGKLLWVIEHARVQDFEILTYANYHLAFRLTILGSNDLALGYSRRALQNSRKYKLELLCDCSVLEALILYKLQRYDEAAQSYLNILKQHQNKDYLFKASMYNNISLCKTNLNDFSAAEFYIQKSLYNIDKIKNPNFDVLFFKIIVEGNLGSNYFKLKKYELAMPLLEKEVAFYAINKINLAESSNPLSELLKIYTIKKDEVKKTETINRVLSLESYFKNETLSNRFTKILYDYSFSVNDYPKLKIYSGKLIRNNKLISDSIINNLMNLNNSIYTQRLYYLKTQFQYKKKLLESQVKSEKNTTILLIVACILLCIIFIIIFIGRSKRSKKNILIAEQNQLLEQNRRIILENDLKLKQEKITSLALNLNLKKETEKAFLEKIKEIKRKKNIEIESVLRELQHSVNNLLQIDNKNLMNSQESTAENINFTSLLKEKHPNLTEQEIGLCTYFRLGLNSKEIAALNNMTSGTIRVYKTKIKTKIGLSLDKNLNNYLVSLSEN